jgi:hypothetical protein
VKKLIEKGQSQGLHLELRNEMFLLGGKEREQTY